MAQQDDGGMVAPGWLRSAVEQVEGDTRLDGAAARLEAAAQPFAQGRRGEVLGGQWLGHALHPLLTDLPLGCFVSSALLDLLGGRSAQRASQRLVGLGLVFSGPTLATGMADYATAGPRDPRVRRLGFVHGIGNVVVGGLYLRSWRSRRAGRQLAGVSWGLMGGGAAMVTGWLGAHMTTALAAAEGERGLPRSEAPPPGATSIGGRDAAAVPFGGP